MSKIEGIVYLIFIASIFLFGCLLVLIAFNNKALQTFKDFIIGWSSLSYRASTFWLLFGFIPFLIFMTDIQKSFSLTLESTPLLTMLVVIIAFGALIATFTFPFAFLLFSTGVITSIIVSVKYRIRWQRKLSMMLLNAIGCISTIFIGQNFPFDFRGIG